ncbi:MAG: GTPase Era [Bacteroidales bacterium]|nr:GTPase Era [Bacteroidales bacterium]
MSHKAGFVNIIGYPNVGKSTLMNALVGEKLSIITSKAQTTRHRILGIVNGDDFQIVYSDTPGIVRDPAYKMHEKMNNYIETALIDADVILLLTEPGLRFSDEKILQGVISSTVPVLVLINKIDLSSQEIVEEQIQYWREKIPKSEVMPVSALQHFNIEKVFDSILERLPESPAYYPKDELTDRSERFFVSEMIREKIFQNYKKEVPYSVEVAVELFQETEKLIKIFAIIFVERESQKAIVLGHNGSAIKKTGTMAREAIEEFFGKKVYLQLTVKVNKDWRNNDKTLERFGYDH